MANKNLKVGGGIDLKLPAKKGKGEKKPKWQGKIGKKAETLVEAPVLSEQNTTPSAEATILPTEPTDAANVAATTAVAEVEPRAVEMAATTPEAATEPTEPTKDESPSKKPKKLKVKAELKPKKLSMMAAALQVLQERKMAMTCPEIIDVLATEGYGLAQGARRQQLRSTPLNRGLSKTVARLRRSARRCAGDSGEVDTKLQLEAQPFGQCLLRL